MRRTAAPAPCSSSPVCFPTKSLARAHRLVHVNPLLSACAARMLAPAGHIQACLCMHGHSGLHLHGLCLGVKGGHQGGCVFAPAEKRKRGEDEAEVEDDDEEDDEEEEEEEEDEDYEGDDLSAP